MNKINFILGIAWCAYFFGIVTADVGEMTGGPQLLMWWDAIWIPIVAAVFPFVLGISVYWKK
jgi:hypothetical protein